MDFTSLSGFKTAWYLFLLIVLVAILFGLLKSAMKSWKTSTGSKWKSIIDEIGVGFVVIVAFYAIAKQEPSTVIAFILKPLEWVWGLILEALRFVGVDI